MTLNSRNRLMKTLSTISVSQFIIFLAFFLYRLFTEHNIPLEFTDFILDNSSVKSIVHSFFQPYSYAALGAVAILAIYTPLTCMIITYVFEKTQSPEILYFLGFLAGCMFEPLRLCIPLFNLWDGYSDFLIYIGKFVFAGRILAVLSLLFSSVFSADDKIQEADRNIVIALAISFILASAVAIDTRTILPSIMVRTSFHQILYIMFFFLAAVTVFAFLFNRKIKTMIAYILLFSGYVCLTLTSSIFPVATGLILISTGTIFYFKVLHTYYLWK
ncbi:MAG: hypothetical protein K5930_10400 [Treponemataceae bacterium]|nr:hypothetical protein [Treponemataceae bacterium]